MTSGLEQLHIEVRGRATSKMRARPTPEPRAASVLCNRSTRAQWAMSLFWISFEHQQAER
jgi:hypothetical protein